MLIKNIEQGGLKLCHFSTKVKALKLAWLKRLCDKTDERWKFLPKYFYNCNNLNLYFSANHMPSEIVKIYHLLYEHT